MSMDMDAKAASETLVGSEFQDEALPEAARKVEEQPQFDARASARATLRRYPIVMAKLAE